MAQLSDIYGNGYGKKDLHNRRMAILDTIAGSIAHLQFVFKTDTSVLWENGRLADQLGKYLAKKAHSINGNVFVIPMDEKSKRVLPYLPKTKRNACFFVISLENGIRYQIYITNEGMDVF